MDMTGLQGGEVTPSEDAELIAESKPRSRPTLMRWTKFSADFEYLSQATPEMINIVISAGDYFAKAEDVGEGNGIDVDNLSLVYVQTGIDEINVGDALVEYYNLGGMRVDAQCRPRSLYQASGGIRRAK